MDRAVSFLIGATPPLAIGALYYKDFKNVAMLVFLAVVLTNQSIAIQCLRTSGGAQSKSFFFSVGSLISCLLAMVVVMMSFNQVSSRMGAYSPQSLSERLNRSTTTPAL